MCRSILNLYVDRSSQHWVVRNMGGKLEDGKRNSIQPRTPAADLAETATG